MLINKNIIITRKHEKPILADVFYKGNSISKPILVFCHGYKGFKDWGAWDLMAKAYANAGFFFIKFNFSYNGGTVEQPIDFLDLEAFGNNNYTKELNDLETIIDWIYSQKEYKEDVKTDSISLIGHSRAGGIVIIKAEEDNRIKNVITLAGVCDFAKRTAMKGEVAQWKKDGVKYVFNGRTKQQMPHYYQFYEDFIKNEDRLTIKRAVTNLKQPHLIIHGNGDTSVLVDEANNLHKWNANSELKIVEGANHVFGASHPWDNDELPHDLKNVTAVIIKFLHKKV